MTALEHYQAGRLSDAIAAAVQDVKAAPTSLGKRTFLAELLCFSGDLDRADTHLDALARQNPELAPGVALFRQLIRAEQARRQFYEEGRVPEVVHQPSQSLRSRIEATVFLREGDVASAKASLETANAAALPCGTVDGQKSECFRDLDDLTADVFEIFTPNGKFFWIAMEQVVSVEFRAPQSPRELLWRPAEMVVRDGPEGEVYFPTLYCGSHNADDDATKLGRATDWRDEAGIMRGVGQRMFLAGEEAKSVLDLQSLELQPTSLSKA